MTIYPYPTFRINPTGRAPLARFMVTALEACGCSVIHVSPPSVAPFAISFETPTGERMGIVGYAFTANSRLTRHRPADEHRFQVKYGSNDRRMHELWQDPFGIFTTLFLGINPELGLFVGADPVLNSPTRFFISKEFKEEHVGEILRRGWYAWEREQRSDRHGQPTEVLVGGTPENFLRYVLFEREALGEDQGHRHLLAEQFSRTGVSRDTSEGVQDLPIVSRAHLHALEREFELERSEILDLIAQAPRLKMAVRGWVAERHLVEVVRRLPEVMECEQLFGDGQPDLRVRLSRGRSVLVECKNVLRRTSADGYPRLDFMRTRGSMADPCSRYYGPSDFDVVAACLHAQVETWTFKARRTATLDPHHTCGGKLSHRVTIDSNWSTDLAEVLSVAATC